jgi:hypothetical protein
MRMLTQALWESIVSKKDHPDGRSEYNILSSSQIGSAKVGPGVEPKYQ